MSDISTPTVERFRKQGRSAVTNGKRVLLGASRTQRARRYHDLIQLYVEEIGGMPSTSDMALIKQAAALAIRSEILQADIVNGVPVAPDDVIRVSSEIRRIIDALKVRSAKNKPAAAGADDLDNYLRNHPEAA